MDWTAFGEFVNDVGGVAIGLAGTVVAGIAIVLSYRDRTAHYRRYLYEKQVEALMEVADAAGQLVRWTLTAALGRSREEAGKPLFQDHPARQALIRLRQRTQVVLPNAVNLNLARFMDAAWEVTGIVVPGQGATPADLSPMATSQLLDSYQALLASVRASLGIDALSQETLNLVTRDSPPSK